MLAKNLNIDLLVFSESKAEKEKLISFFNTRKAVFPFLTFKEQEENDVIHNRYTRKTLAFVIISKNEAAGFKLVMDLRYKMPFSTIFLLIDKSMGQHIQQYFLFGANGVIALRSPDTQFEKMVLDYFKKDIPPISSIFFNDIIHMLGGGDRVTQGLELLSIKQRHVAILLMQGLTYLQISEKLNMNIDTVRYHVKQVYSKLQVKNKMQLVPYMQSENE